MALHRAPNPRQALLFAGAALALGACAGPTLDAPVETLIEFEATWQCDVTRFTFASVQEIDEKRDGLRDRFEVSAQDHKIFTDMVEDDADLRGQLADRVDSKCAS